jgi:serine/threonine protein kinase
VKTAGFWTKDWFLGLAVAIVLAAFAGSDLIQSLERKAYDLGVRAAELAGKKIDGRSDVFSLAVSLYHLLCGRLPFDGESMAQLMFKIANEPAPDILQFSPRLPPALVAFLGRSMAKEAEARFQTGEEFAQALRACTSVQKSQVDITI